MDRKTTVFVDIARANPKSQSCDSNRILHVMYYKEYRKYTFNIEQDTIWRENSNYITVRNIITLKPQKSKPSELILVKESKSNYTVKRFKR
jgi:hypothetical protein